MVRCHGSPPFQEQNPAISPDGRWLAYQSNESGRYEVYVAVPIATSPEFAAGAPRVLFLLPEDAYVVHFVVDGERFPIARRTSAAVQPHAPLIVTENWTQELRQLTRSAARP